MQQEIFTSCCIYPIRYFYAPAPIKIASGIPVAISAIKLAITAVDVYTAACLALIQSLFAYIIAPMTDAPGVARPILQPNAKNINAGIGSNPIEIYKFSIIGVKTIIRTKLCDTCFKIVENTTNKTAIINGL